MIVAPTTPPEMAWIGELTPGAIGIWSLLAVVLVAIIRAWPVLTAQAIGAREKLRGEGRSDLSDCKERIDKLQGELNSVREDVHKFEMKLLGAISAYRILDAEIQIIRPESAALVQARAVMSTAFTVSPSTDAPFPMPEDLR